MKKDNKIKILTITLITAILMGISSIMVYSNICAPKFYDYFIDTGVKYLMDGKYEEAILAFNKAIEIEEKSTEARVYLAEGYVGNNEHDKAIEVLKEAQELDITNEELLKQILEILKEIDSDIAYEFLDRFIEYIGKDNISKEIEDILNSAYERPINPIADPAPGTYIKPISVKLKLDEIKIGHSFYYTTDGSNPNKSSQKYSGKIDIDKNTTIKLIGYNKNNESTELIALDYIIDNTIINQMNENIKEIQALVDLTIEGTNIGNCIKGSKEPIIKVIHESNQLIKKEEVTYEQVVDKKKELNNALEQFKDNIIKKTDKSKLVAKISEAETLFNNSKEGNEDGLYKVGSKDKLKKAISRAKVVNEDILSKQLDIDSEVKYLNNSIYDFKNSKVSSFTGNKAIEILSKECKDIHVGKKKEFSNNFPGYIYSYRYELYSGMKVENNVKYYEVMNVSSLLDSNGNPPPTDDQYDDGGSWASFGTIYRVYENGEIIPIQFF